MKHRRKRKHGGADMSTMAVQNTTMKSCLSLVDKACPSDKFVKITKSKMNKYERTFTELSDEEIKLMQELMDNDE